jgi:hypothetical protein
MRDKLIEITLGTELIICLVLPVLCSIMALHWQRNQIYQKIESDRIAWASPDEMICLTFSSSDLPQVNGKKSNRTIDHLGERYHIVQTENVGDTTLFWCLAEISITDLKEVYADILTRYLERNSRRQEQKSLLFQYFQSLYFEVNAIELYASFDYLDADKFRESTQPCIAPFLSPPAPPPKRDV